MTDKLATENFGADSPMCSSDVNQHVNASTSGENNKKGNHELTTSANSGYFTGEELSLNSTASKNEMKTPSETPKESSLGTTRAKKRPARGGYEELLDEDHNDLARKKPIKGIFYCKDSACERVFWTDQDLDRHEKATHDLFSIPIPETSSNIERVKKYDEDSGTKVRKSLDFD